MSATDRTAAARGEPPDEPDVDPPVTDIGLTGLTGPPGPGTPPTRAGTAARGLADLGDRDALPAFDPDVRLDRATAARLRDEARRTRPRVARRLADAGHHPSLGRPPGEGYGPDGADELGRPEDVDGQRDLGRRLDENVAFFEHIDALHDRRTHSPSPRERQVATRALAEALHRIVSGYRVDDEPPHRPVMAARLADEGLGRAIDRLAVRGPQRQAATRWWARDGRWVRLGLALVAFVLLAENQMVAAAVTVTARSALSVALYAPASPVGTRKRLLGYDPFWPSCVSIHLGDAAVVAGMGLGLHLGGHTEWGVATVFAALFGLLATMTRMTSEHHGFRLPRLWFDRVAMTLALPAAAVAAAVLGPDGPGTLRGVPVAGAVVLVVTAIGVVQVGRTVYFALCRGRLFRRAAAADPGEVPDAIVAHTGDAIVVNLSRQAATRPPVFDLDDEGRHLRAVGPDGS